MSRSKQPRSAADPSVLVAVAPLASGGWVAAALHVGAGRARLIASAEFPADGAALANWCRQEQHAERTVLVLADGLVVARTVAIPVASSESMQMALSLQLENFVLGGTPRHRTAAAPLASSFGDRRAGLLLEWPESSQAVGNPLGSESDPAVSRTAPIAAMAALLDESRKPGGSAGPFFHVDRAAGVLSLAVADGDRFALRTVREATDSTDDWGTLVRRAAEETAMAAGFDDAAAAALGAAAAAAPNGLSVPQSARACLTGAPSDSAWWSKFGLAVGAALAAGGSLAPLTELRGSVIRSREGLITSTVEWLSRPKTATKLIIAALVAMAVLPPAIAWGRLELLRARLEDPTAYRTSLRTTEQQLTIYREMPKLAWPMTKLLGDIASTTPEGIELEVILLVQGDRVNLRGVARPQGGASGTDAILEMERQMRGSRIFDRIEKSWDPPDAKGVFKFTILATVSDPILVPDYPEAQDFGRRTLRDRRYGTVETAAATTPSTEPVEAAPEATDTGSEAAVEVASAATDGTAAPAEDDAATRSTTRRDTTGSGNLPTDVARRGRTPTTVEAGSAIPDPITDEQINAMTQAEAREVLGKVAKAINGSVDPPTKERLRAEFQKLMARAKKQ